MTAMRVLPLAGGVPHLPGVADHRRHRRVDDDVARHVQVGDAVVGVDHRERRARPASRGGDVGLDRRRARSRAACATRASTSARPSLGFTPMRSNVSPCFANTSAKYVLTACPKMIGSETFIIVALRCTENSTPCAFASAICAARNASSAPRVHERGVDDLARQHGDRLLQHGDAAVGARRARPAASSSATMVTDCSLERKSSWPMVATRVFESGDHAPI